MPKPTESARIISRREVEARTGLSRAYIYRLAEAGELPAAVQLTRYRIGWVEAEIDAWIAERIQKRAEERAEALARARTARKARKAA